MNTINIKGVTYNFKQTFRGLLQYEEMTGKGLDKMSGNLTDLFTLFYCFLCANNVDTFRFSFSDFLDLIDEEPEVVSQLSNLLKPDEPKVAAEPAKKKVKK